MDWDNIQTFLAVFRAGRLSLAARELGVSEATARRRLDDLEALGVGPLFERTSGGLSPTTTATKLAQLAGRMESELLAVAHGGTGARREIVGEVRVTADELIALEVLPPLFSDLSRLHPHLVLKLGVTAEREDLLLGEADIAIRLFRPTQKSLVARQIPGGRLGLFAHRHYLARAGTPRSLEDLSAHDLVGAAQERSSVTGFEALGLSPAATNIGLRIDSPLGQMRAVRGGLGIGVGLAQVASRDPDLVRVLPEVGADVTIWVSVHEDQRDVPRVRAVFDAINRFLLARPVKTSTASEVGELDIVPIAALQSSRHLALLPGRAP
jgi:DNA-binding transcriptional LysR family regulator